MIKFFSSVKVAVTLIALLVASSVFATLYPGINVYGSFWFRGLLLLFCLNLLVCTLKRVPAIVAKIKEQPDFQELQSPEIVLETDGEGQDTLYRFLKDKGYKTKVRQDTQGSQNILAQKGILSLVAPHLLHVSLIVIFLGAFLGTFGAQDRVMIFLGEQGEVAQDLYKDMVVELNEFTTLYDEGNAVDNWVSDITIYVGGQEVARGTTRVNHPFKYKGVVFYQSAYGHTHLVEITGDDEGAYLIPNNKTFNIGATYFNLNQGRTGALLKVYQDNRLLKTSIMLPEDKIDITETATLEYLQLHPYTVLAVKTDPGTEVVMLGFFLLTISSTFFWTGRYREIKIRIPNDKKVINIKVNCKNKAIKEQVIVELTKGIQGGH